jgi:hypothetical protein
MRIFVEYFVGDVRHSKQFSFQYSDYNPVTKWDIVNAWLEKNVPEGSTALVRMD